MSSGLSNEDFANLAHPYRWLLVADNLHAQAKASFDHNRQTLITQLNADGVATEQWALTDRPTFLLAGFALENAIKSFLVFENPLWVSNGTLARPLRSHELTQLADKSRHITYKKKGRQILAKFEDGLEGWARYPCGLSREDSKRVKRIDDELFRKHCWLFQSYTRKLCSLVKKQWKGAHNTGGMINNSRQCLAVVDSRHGYGLHRNVNCRLPEAEA